MRKLALTIAAMTLFPFAVAVHADTLLNMFDSPFDYVVNGIVGDTNWDGVYLRYGDVPGGSAGGSGNGNTVIANTTSFGGGLLGLQSQGNDWSGADDDGFFVYKVVQGDFDVSVQNVPGGFTGGLGYDSRAYHFAGLMVRAYHTNNSGAPFSTTLTNNAENFILLWRFNEFGIDGQIRTSTNGVNQERNWPGSNDETNSTRFFRITRAGDVFTFYVKTNSFEGWHQVTNGLPAGTFTRSDWSGVALQVGIAQATFNAGARDAFFDDFTLSGPNVTFPAMPTPASSLMAIATNTGGSLTLSWTLGTPGDGSLVVMSRRPIQHNPVQGITYNANSTYGDPGTLLGGGGQYVVYNGTGNSVTVTNLGANNLTYYVAVYEYSGSGASTVYNTASPATNVLAGPGVITAAYIVAPTNGIPISGAVALKLMASFSTGESNVDQTLNATWSSGNPSVANVNAAGTVSGLSTGSSLIMATFGSFNPSVSISVYGPAAFQDSFGATHDYLVGGLLGSVYDGLFLKFGDVPGGVAGNDGAGNTTALDSQISNTNGLFMNSVASTWQGTADDGPFLFKLVPGANNLVSGDFQAAVHINNMNVLNGVVAGIMARCYNPANGGPGPGGSENHVNYWKVQNGTTSVRRILNGATTTLVAAGPAAANGWLLIQRVDSTNFYFFERATTNDLWTFVTNTVLTTAANNAPMEVGVAQQSTTGVNGLTTFDGFWLDTAGISGGTPPPAPTDLVMLLNDVDLSITLNWVAADGSGNPIQSMVVMRAGGPVTAQPIMGTTPSANSVFGLGTDLGGRNYVVFVSDPTPASTNNSVTVTGLTPGVNYSAAIYTFAGSGPTRVFNGAGIGGAIVNGHPLTLVTPSAIDLPAGGIGTVPAQVGYGVSNPVVYVDKSASVVVTSGDPAVFKVLAGVLTGISNGTAVAAATYTEGSYNFSNSVNVTVRSPIFADNFGVNQDYLNNGVTGSGWDGIYDQATRKIPGSLYVPPVGAGAIVADANISSNNVLTITASGDGWENDLSGGFFLWKYAPGNFQMAVHIMAYDIAAYNQPGLLARAYGVTNSTIGVPLGYIVPNANGTNDAGEYWVSFCRFDEFGIGTYARRNIDDAVSQNTQPDINDTNFWLLINRNGTEFDFYKRYAETDPWRQVPNKTHYSISQFAGMPMQVGVMAGPWTGPGDNRTVQFEKFMLDMSTASTIQYSLSPGNITLIWPADPRLVLESTASLTPANWLPVGGSPILNTNGYSLTLPVATTGSQYFRVKQ